jgi:hypothetical protein
MQKLLALVFVLICAASYAQVDTSHVYNTSMPYGTLDIRLRKSATRYYYLQDGKTFSFRESSPGVRTGTYRDMTSWDSSPFTQGNLRERNGTADNFVLNYRLLFPNNFDQNYEEGYPLIVMMHGLGERGNCWDANCYHATPSWNSITNYPPAPTTSDHRLLNNDHNLLHGGLPHLNARNLAGNRLPNDPTMPTRAFPGLILFPQNVNGWTTSTIQDVIRIVRLVQKKYNVDPNRIVIHGLSNGGSAVFECLKRAPWLFTAALPMSAVSDASINAQGMAPRIAHIPLWIFQGGLDTNPTPFKTESTIKKFREQGMTVRYSKYGNLGHGTWNTAYAEPDFFTFILSQHKSKVQVFANNSAICLTTGTGVTMRLASGFLKYEWELDGVVIPGATGPNYVANTPGVYRARFSRVANPGPDDWNQWSQEITVTEQNPGQATMTQVGTVLIKGLDNYANARLVADGRFDHYYWYKNGVRLTTSDTTKFPIFKPGDCSTGACVGNGVYTLVVAGYDNCPSPVSEPKYVFFNNNGPINMTAPTTFAGTILAPNKAKLTWVDNTNNEVGFEIWRRRNTGGTTYTPWSMAAITGPNATEYIDAKLEPSSLYQFKIRATSATGRSNYTPSASNQYLILTTTGDPVAPTPPSNVEAELVAVGALKVSWTPGTDDIGIREYQIYNGTTLLASTASSNPTFVVRNLAPNLNLSLNVVTRDLGGNLSSPSETIPATTYMEGLFYTHSTGAWNDLDVINWNVAEYTGWVSNITLSERSQQDYFNFYFDGFLHITQGGQYQFSTASDDGSRVEVDGVIVAEHDGLHGAVTTTGPVVTLASGGRRFKLKYFEYDGGESLTVRYKGPDTNGNFVTIPTSAFKSGVGIGGAASMAAEPVAIPEYGSERIALYPNPGRPSDLTIKIEDVGDAPARVRLMDMAGRLHHDESFESEAIRKGANLNVSRSIQDGLYLIAVDEGNGHVTKKLVIIKN